MASPSRSNLLRTKGLHMTKAGSAKWSTVIFLYAASLLGGGLSLWLIARYGQQIPVTDTGMANMPVVAQGHSLSRAVVDGLRKNFSSPIAGFVLQVLTILVASRICGLILRRLGQPRVMGEIIAGICLGPSLLKAVFPELHGFLFPESSLPRLFFLANIGLILFMFTIGLELDLNSLGKRVKSAVLISHMSIVVQFVLGADWLCFCLQTSHRTGTGLCHSRCLSAYQ
jgi:hypothetical protein